jgi:hypothetical protein
MNQLGENILLLDLKVEAPFVRLLIRRETLDIRILLVVDLQKQPA